MLRRTFLISALLALACAALPAQTRIILATTTSTADTGLLDHLLPRFQARTGIAVKPIAVGTGEALAMGRRGDADVLLGEIGGAPFYMSAAQFDYWRHTQLIIDVVPGRGGMFSLENGREKRFLTRSRLFTDAEAAAIE